MDRRHRLEHDGERIQNNQSYDDSGGESTAKVTLEPALQPFVTLSSERHVSVAQS